MNRNDLKEYYRKLKQEQQAKFTGGEPRSGAGKRILNETREIKDIQISEFKTAIKQVGFDLEGISSYLGVHPDDISDNLELVMKALAQEMINKYANPDYYMSDSDGIADPSFYSDDSKDY